MAKLRLLIFALTGLLAVVGRGHAAERAGPAETAGQHTQSVPSLVAPDAPYTPAAEQQRYRVHTGERVTGGNGASQASVMRRRRTPRASFVATSLPHAHQRRSVHDQSRFPIHSAPGRAGTYG